MNSISLGLFPAGYQSRFSEQCLQKIGNTIEIPEQHANRVSYILHSLIQCIFVCGFFFFISFKIRWKTCKMESVITKYRYTRASTFFIFNQFFFILLCFIRRLVCSTNLFISIFKLITSMTLPCKTITKPSYLQNSVQKKYFLIFLVH